MELLSLNKKAGIIPSLKNVDTMAINTKGPLVRLAVASKKKLMLFEYAKGGYQILREMAVPDTVLTMIWHGPTVCIGCKREYTILHQVHLCFSPFPPPASLFHTVCLCVTIFFVCIIIIPLPRRVNHYNSCSFPPFPLFKIPQPSFYPAYLLSYGYEKHDIRMDYNRWVFFSGLGRIR